MQIGFGGLRSIAQLLRGLAAGSGCFPDVRVARTVVRLLQHNAIVALSRPGPIDLKRGHSTVCGKSVGDGYPSVVGEGLFEFDSI